jgi:kynurenine formamidase
MKRALLLTLVLCSSPLALADGHCKHSQLGPDDEIGAANRITPESVLKAAKLIRTGKTYSLGITIDHTTPAFPPGGLSLVIVQPNQQESARPFANLTYNDDIFMGWLGIGSQIDGLGHVGDDGMYYNCNHARDFSAISGLTKLGVEKVPPIVARGIVLDMAGHYGVPNLDAGQYFTVDDVKTVEKKQGTPIMGGDVVLFHTGWTDAKLVSDPIAWASGEPGQSEEVADYLASKNVVAVGADTWGVDVVPSQSKDKSFHGHKVYLMQNGIFIFEVMNTGPLVRDEAFEFLFVLGQAKVRGTAQMIINPVAIR